MYMKLNLAQLFLDFHSAGHINGMANSVVLLFVIAPKINSLRMMIHHF